MNNNTPYFKTDAEEITVGSGDAARAAYATDTNGVLEFTDIPAGHFAVREVKAPDGYEPAE